MNLLFALATATLFGSGIFLMLSRDLLRVVAGTVMISNSVFVFIMGTGLMGSRAPIIPPAAPSEVSDPVVQALTLTAIVISFGTTALLFALVYRVCVEQRSIDTEEMERLEVEEEMRTEPQERPESGS